MAVRAEDTTKQKGDLLEGLAEKLLKTQNYEVETEIRKVGAELDLLCTNKANKNKKIYVECKAYKEDSKIQAGVIKNIVGMQAIEEYDEVWLISTSELGKDAKGLVDKLITEQGKRNIVIYTPTKLLEALESAKNIINYSVVEKSLEECKIYKGKYTTGGIFFIITEFGYFYVTVIRESGEDKGVIIHDTESGEILSDPVLLSNIKKLETSFRTLNFQYIFNFIENMDVSTKNVINVKKIEQPKLNTQYLKKINDTGIKLTHPNKSELTLDDIFVFQDLQDIENSKNIGVSSGKLLDLSFASKAIIFGEEVSGKTSLMSILQKKLNENNLIPVYFNAKNIKSSEFDRFQHRFLRNFKKQYQDTDNASILKLIEQENNKIVILIDNFETLSIKKLDSRVRFLGMLNKKFNNIFIFSDKSAEMEIMTKDELKSKLDDVKFFRIKQYGYQLRDKVIEKWLTIGQEETIDQNFLWERKDEVFNMIETVIGNKFIPTYPLYIITLLQQIEAGTGSNLGGSAYAEFYNYLIVQAMGTTKIKTDELDFYHTYLSFIAYSYFKNGRKELDKTEIMKLHDEHGYIYHRKSFTQVYDNLIGAKFIKEDNEFYSFNHNYIYYFYVAKYLSDNTEEAEIVEEINMLIKRLYRVEFANIIIFLIHHSKTRAKSIIGKITSEAKALFSDINPSTLSKTELSNINQLVTEEIRTIIQDKDPQKHREETFTLKDERDDMRENEDKLQEGKDGFMPQYNEDIHELDIYGKINLSFKLMEILGQISKNYYGSLKNEAKSDILKELTSLGLRNLNLLLKQFNKYSDLLEKDIREKIEKDDVRSSSEIKTISKRIVFNFAELISMNFIKKISSSMASKNLFATIDGLPKDTEAMKLIAIATKMDFSGGLNKDNIIALDREFSQNIIAKELLKHLVIEHLYKFNVPYKKKQEVCDKLNIGIQMQKNILVHKSRD